MCHRSVGGRREEFEATRRLRRPVLAAAMTSFFPFPPELVPLGKVLGFSSSNRNHTPRPTKSRCSPELGKSFFGIFSSCCSCSPEMGPFHRVVRVGRVLLPDTRRGHMFSVQALFSKLETTGHLLADPSAALVASLSLLALRSTPANDPPWGRDRTP